MNYLLDTHTLIWFLEGDDQLSGRAKKAIEGKNSRCFVSIASLWEIAIKISLEKLFLKDSFFTLSEQIHKNGFQILPIVFEDTLVISKLPFHHKDPFDRAIIAQGLTNVMTIITKDNFFDAYDHVKLLW